jgi:hypothetical protein
MTSAKLALFGEVVEEMLEIPTIGCWFSASSSVIWL